MRLKVRSAIDGTTVVCDDKGLSNFSVCTRGLRWGSTACAFPGACPAATMTAGVSGRTARRLTETAQSDAVRSLRFGSVHDRRALPSMRVPAAHQ
jgi:hypothetical protein